MTRRPCCFIAGIANTIAYAAVDHLRLHGHNIDLQRPALSLKHRCIFILLIHHFLLPLDSESDSDYHSSYAKIHCCHQVNNDRWKKLPVRSSITSAIWYKAALKLLAIFLPPVRELAGKLAVNRNTVAAAYKRLVTSGRSSVRGVMATPLKSIILFPPLKGDPSSPLKDISSGNPDPARLADLATSPRCDCLNARLYGDAADEPRPPRGPAARLTWIWRWAPRLTSPAAPSMRLSACYAPCCCPAIAWPLKIPAFSSINMLRYASFTLPRCRSTGKA